MNEFGQKGKISDKDFMPEGYDVILNGLENHLTATGDDMLTIDVIHKKLNHPYKKIKSKKKEKTEKEKALGAYNSCAVSMVSTATN